MSIASWLGVRPPGDRVERWHISPAVDLMAYAFSWVWVLVPMLFVGDDNRVDYLTVWIVTLVVTDVHRHYGLPYVYMDSQVRRRYPLRFFFFPAVLLLLWGASPWLVARNMSVAPASIGAIVAGTALLFQVLGQDGDPAAESNRGLSLVLGTALGAPLLLGMTGLAGAIGLDPGWWWLAGCFGASLTLHRRIQARRRERNEAPGGMVALPLIVFTMLVVLFGQAMLPAQVGVARVIFTIAVAAGLWNFWHVYMQKYGIMRLYNAKSGADEKVDGWIDRTMLFAWLPLYFAYLGPAFRGMAVKYFPVARHMIIPVTDWLETYQHICLPASAGFLLWALFMWFRAEWRATRLKNRPRLCMMLGTNLLASCFLFMHPVKVYVAFAFSHAVEYMVFVWAFQRRRYLEELPHRPLLGRVLRHPMTAYLAFVAVLGAIFTYTKFWGIDLAKGSGAPQAFGYTTAMWMFYWGVYQSMQHFYYDGFLWKMRTKTVQQSI